MQSKKMFLSIMILFTLTSFPFINAVRASSELWSQTYGGTSSYSAEAIVQTSDGGYALAGYTRSFGVGPSDFWLVKTDANGNMEWNQTYGEGIARSLVEVSDGGLALVGYTSSIGTGSTDFWLIKTDAYGIPEFSFMDYSAPTPYGNISDYNLETETTQTLNQQNHIRRLIILHC